MAATTTDLVDETVQGLHGFTGDLENFTTLLSDLDVDNFQFQYDVSQSLGQGMTEIGDEAVYVQSTDSVAGVAKITPWGRGQLGSTPAAHPNGSKITAQPRFPRARVLTTLGEVVNRLSADIFSIQTYDFAGQPAVFNYPMPAGTAHILRVEQQTYGPSLLWEEVHSWRMDHSAYSAEFPSGISLTLPRGALPGRDVRVTYGADLLPLTADGLLTDTGLAESTRDLVVMGAQAKLLLTQDFTRLQLGAVEQQQRNSQVPVTSATKVASQLEQMFQLRLDEEVNQLYRFFPNAVVRVG